MKRGYFTAAVFFALAVVISVGQTPQAPPIPPTPVDTTPAVQPTVGKPRIKFDKTVYDFGKTSESETVTGTFVFQNVGDGVLKLGKPTTTCGCTVASVKPDTLKPGEKGELTFTLSLGRSRAVLQKNITVDSNDPITPKTLLTVKADYTPLYETRPVTFYMNLRKGETTNVATRVTRTDGKPFTISKIKSAPWIEAKAQPDPAATTNQTMLIISTLKPEGNPRYFSERLEIFVNDAAQPSFNVNFTGRILGDLTWTPENVYWPVTDPSKAVTSRRIVLRSSVPGKLEIKNLTSTLGNLSVESVAKPDGKTMELVAKLDNIPDRSTNGVIRFETNIPSQPTVEVPVWINIVKR